VAFLLCVGVQDSLLIKHVFLYSGIPLFTLQPLPATLSNCKKLLDNVTMKKKIIGAFALSAVATASLAQSNVTLYGVADIGLHRSTNTAGGTQLQLASGLMEGSRWGLRGNEDLGGGMRAIFTLENRFELDTGALSNRPISGAAVPARLTRNLPGAVAAGLSGAVGPLQGVNLGGNLFDRQAFVGLVTPVGAFLFGRQYTPAFQTFAKYDINGTSSAAAPGSLGMIFYQPVEIRRDNSIQYVIQQSGISASLMHSFGESRTSPATPSSAGSMSGINFSYDGGPLSAGVGYNTSKDLAGQTSLQSTVAGISYDFGFMKLSGEVLNTKDDNPVLVNRLAANPAAAPLLPALSLIKGNLIQDSTLAHIGASFGVGAGTLKVSFNRLNDKRAANADSSSVGATYTYPFSKRTDLNLIVARVNNKGQGQVALGGNGFSGGITNAAAVDSNNFGVGIRHRF
jgi:predicted porin